MKNIENHNVLGKNIEKLNGGNMITCHCVLPTINPLACKNCPNNKETIEYDIVEDVMDEYHYNEELENYKDNIKDIADYLSGLTIQ